MNKSIEEVYNYIVNDHDIIDLYEKIGNIENSDKGWAYHNLQHVKNVTKMIEDILENLNYDKDFILKAKIAGMLHDVGVLQGKENHAERSYLFAQQYFNDNNISFMDMDEVLEAIKIHSDGFETDNIIALTLVFADKLDIKYTRVANEGKNIKGMRQLLYIKDITINISNKDLNVNFMVDERLNIEELNEFYFTKKVFSAINSFSNKINLTPKIFMNNKIWKI